MFFFFTCGTHTFSSRLKGYEQVTVQCQNCGNHSAHVYKRWQWFTFCFVPVVPFSLKPWKEVGCHVCHFSQDIKYRPDATAQAGGGAPPLQAHQQHSYAMGPPPQHHQGVGQYK